MGLGVLATLAAPREARHTIRETRVDDMPRVAARDGLEWVARLGVLAAGALILGSGLAANASLLADLVAGLGLAGTADALLAAWRGPAGLWFQLFAVLAGFVVIAMAVSPVPGSRTRGLACISAARSAIRSATSSPATDAVPDRSSRSSASIG